MSAPNKEAGTVSRKTSWLISAALVWGAVVVFAAPALAAPRAYDSQMNGFQSPDAVTIGVGDQVWVSDTGSGVISQWTPFPSQEKLGDQDGGGRWSSGETGPRGPAVSAQTGFLIAGELGAASACGGAEYYAFDNFGQFLFKDAPGEGFVCMIWLAFDNSPTSDSYGSYYALSSGIVEKRDGYGNPVDFIGTASYISGNTITGTPKGAFGNASGNFYPDGSGITVDSEGNIWVINRERREIDEFDSTGVFIRRINAETTTIPAAETPMGPKGFGSYPGLTGVAVDPTTGNVLVSDRGALVVREFSPSGEYLNDITGADTPAGKFGFICNSFACFDSVYGVAVNSQGYVYVADGEDHVVDIFKPQPRQPTVAYKPDTNPTPTSGTVNATADPNGGGDITSCRFEYRIATAEKYTLPPITCSPDPSGSHFSVPTDVHADLTGLSTETTYRYRVVVGNANATRIGAERTLTPHDVIGLRAEAATNATASGATLNGSFVGNGAATNYWFEYGTSASYGTKLPLPAPPGASAASPPGPGRTNISLPISGLAPATRYHFRIVADNGSASSSDDQSFRTSALAPQVKQSVTGVHSDQVILNAQVNPGGADTVYNFEFGTEPCSEVPDPCNFAFADTHIGSNFSFAKGSKRLLGLEEGTTYYYRAIATNAAGTTYGPDLHFSTYPFEPELVDTCPNVLARQQTGSALVSDCRGYELVSAAHAGGYDVESTLVPGQTPFDGYPRAENPSRALYGIHNGALPGVAGNPTNRGVDPYVATRGANGWTTSYVGIPANNPNASSPFSSTLAEADPTLQNFAFDGPEICSPCFADGSTGIPVHLHDGSLVQGMRGSIPQTGSAANGLVKKHLSADGRHFVFASTSQFEPAGNNATGDVSIYDRNLGTDTTQVVSIGPSGTALACLQGAGQCHGPSNPAGIAELDMSEDGSRILVGQRTSTDVAGNRPLPPLPPHRNLPQLDRPHPRCDRRRPLRRDDRGWLAGLLHDQGPPGRSRYRQQRRHLRGDGRRRLGEPPPDQHRWELGQQRRRLRTARLAGMERSGRRPGLQRSRLRRGRRYRRRRRHLLLPQPGAARRIPRH